MALSWKSKVTHSTKMSSVKTSLRVHIFKFSAETTLEENPVKGWSVGRISYGALTFK